MNKMFLVTTLFVVFYASVLTPEQKKRAQAKAKIQSLAKQLEQDPSKAKQLCPQLCNRLAVGIAPDTVCGLCYPTCSSLAAPKRKNVRAQLMIRTCGTKGYPAKCCTEISSKCLAQDAQIDQLQVSERDLNLKMQQSQNDIKNLAQQVRQEKQKMIEKERQFKTTLESKARSYKDDLYLKELEYKFTVKNLKDELEEYTISCDKAVLAALESSAPNKFWSLFQVSDFLSKFGNKYLGKTVNFSPEDNKLLQKAINSLHLIDTYHALKAPCQSLLNLAHGYDKEGEPTGGLMLLGMVENLNIIRGDIGNLYTPAQTEPQKRNSAKDLFIHVLNSLKGILKRTKDYLDSEHSKGNIYLTKAQWEAIPKKISETL